MMARVEHLDYPITPRKDVRFHDNRGLDDGGNDGTETDEHAIEVQTIEKQLHDGGRTDIDLKSHDNQEPEGGNGGNVSGENRRHVQNSDTEQQGGENAVVEGVELQEHESSEDGDDGNENDGHRTQVQNNNTEQKRNENADKDDVPSQRQQDLDGNGWNVNGQNRPQVQSEINADNSSKYDIFDESSEKTDNGKSDIWKILEKIARCVFSSFLFAFVLGTAIVSRVSFHIMVENLNPPTNFTTMNKFGGIRPIRIGNDTNMNSMAVVNVSWIWATYLAVLTPYLYKMVHLLWNACRKENLIFDEIEIENNQSKTSDNGKPVNADRNGPVNQQHTNSPEEQQCVPKDLPQKCCKILKTIVFFAFVECIYAVQSIVEIITVFFLLPVFDPCTASVLSVTISLYFPTIYGIYQTYKSSRENGKTPSNEKSPSDKQAPSSEEKHSNADTSTDEESKCKRLFGDIIFIIFKIRFFIYLVSMVMILACTGVITSKLDKENVIAIAVCPLITGFFTSPLMVESVVQTSCLSTHKHRNIIEIIGTFFRIIISFATLLLVFIVRSKGALDECTSVLFYTSRNVTIYMPDQDVTLSSENQYYHRHSFFLTVVCFASAYFCFKSCVMSCRTGIQWQSFSLPLILSYIIVPVILWTVAVYPDKWNTNVFAVVPNNWEKMEKVEYDSTAISLLITSAIVSLLFLLSHTQHIWNRGTKMWQLENLFSSPYYCGLCLDVSILLSRRLSEDDEKKDNDNGEKKKPPFIYICATMWHEEEEEIKSLLKSIFRLHIDFIHIKTKQHMIREWKRKKNPEKNTRGFFEQDYYEFAVHIFFDDAFKKDNVPNEYVEKFNKAMAEAWSSVFDKSSLPKDTKISTPYGGRQEWKMDTSVKDSADFYKDAGQFVLHLKDKRKVKKKKRWSQVMYLYYLLSYKFRKLLNIPMEGNNGNDLTEELLNAEKHAHNIYILALDGDIDFKPNAIRLLLDCMEKNDEVGAACGRIIPMGKGPVVWYQKFEYAASHWLQKSTEHVYGCVLCSPGCFSLFRASALMSRDIIKTYTKEPKEAYEYIQCDQGEDRWLSTLLLKRGFKLEYMAASDARTYAPEGFYEFFKQRRRWSPSTMANILDILWNMDLIINKNSSIRTLFMIYQLFLFLSSIITPGTIFLMILGAIHIAFPSIPIVVIFFLNITPVGVIMVSCLVASDKIQLMIAGVLSSAYSLLMVVVFVGLIIDAVNSEFCSVATYFFSYVVGIFFLSALMHPKEFLNIFCGIIYFLSVPSTSMLMMLYALGNLHVTDWGTREGIRSQKNKTLQENDKKGFSCCGIDCSVKKTKAELNGKQAVQKQKSDVTKKKEKKNKKFIEPEDEDKERKKLFEEEEKGFWEFLVDEYLKPSLRSKTIKGKKKEEIKENLLELRNRVYFAFFLLNGIYVTLVYVVEQVNETNNGKFTFHIPCPNKDDYFDVDPISVIFMITFGLVLFFQFFGMILHRFSTFIHIMAVTKVWKDAADKVIEKRTSTKTEKIGPWRSAIEHMFKGKPRKVDIVNFTSSMVERLELK